MRFKLFFFGIHMMVIGLWIGAFHQGRPFSHWIILPAVCAVWYFVDLWKEGK